MKYLLLVMGFMFSMQTFAEVTGCLNRANKKVYPPPCLDGEKPIESKGVYTTPRSNLTQPQKVFINRK